jgi:transcriptional regulator with XRE-family HTH domain
MPNMKGLELRPLLEKLRISQADLARLVGVTPRAVNSWATSEQEEVPGPVAAYIQLLVSLPLDYQRRELMRLRPEEIKMMDGMYSVEFAGRAGAGYGFIVFNRGRIQGADCTGVQFDGNYFPVAGHNLLNIRVRAVVPAGVWLVQGTPAQPQPYAFSIAGNIAPGNSSEITVQTDFGPVNVRFNFMRTLDNSQAA